MRPIRQLNLTVVTHRNAALVLVGALCPLFQACSCCDSTATEDLIFDVWVESSGEVSLARGELGDCSADLSFHEAGDSPGRIGCGDRLVFEAEEQNAEMMRDPDSLWPQYIASLPFGREGTEVTVTLERTDDEDVHASGTLPDEFEILSVVPPEPSLFTDPIEVRWEPSGSDDQMTVTVADSAPHGCLAGMRWAVDSADDGLEVIPAGALGAMSLQHSPTCDLVLTVSRLHDGSVRGDVCAATFLTIQARRADFVGAL